MTNWENKIPAFLLFQINPSRDSILEGRTLSELWSASYLLSWMTAHAIKAVTDRLGPDSIIFPSLRGNPLYDWLHREQRRHSSVKGEDSAPGTVAEQLGREDGLYRRLAATPCLPGRFLALVSSEFDPTPVLDQFNPGKEDSAWRLVCHACWSFLNAASPFTAAQRRCWEDQIANFWRVTWQIWPWHDVDIALGLLEKTWAQNPAALSKAKALAAAIPAEHREARGTPLEPVWAWNIHWQLADHRFRARQHTHDFSASLVNPRLPNDSLSGRPEAIVDQPWLDKARQSLELQSVFRGYTRLGTGSLIKRVWPVAFLAKRGLEADRFAEMTAQVGPAGVGSDYGFLVLDTDAFCQWILNQKSPLTALAVSSETVQNVGADAKNIEVEKRPESSSPPSAHARLKWSEALSNFSLHGARRIVEHHRGRLVYSGGDQLWAVLPVAEVAACIRGLRLAFQGARELSERYPRLFSQAESGWIRLDNPDRCEPTGPMLLPGPGATFSAGFALAVRHLPMSEVAWGALAALDRSKARPVRRMLNRRTGQFIAYPQAGWDRDAMTFVALEPGIESLYWGAKLDSPGGETFQFVLNLIEGTSSPAPGRTSARRQALQDLALRLKRYPVEQPLTPGWAEIALRELDWAIGQPEFGLEERERRHLLELGRHYLDHLLNFSFHDDDVTQPAPRPLSDFVNLLRLMVFIARDHD
ncbi:MAG: hypothetical protein M1608_17130 [Candidatus Omnitrophica bacterium]|nr:hypothetical protein [Candidatus Omnitrophota bacterium]